MGILINFYNNNINTKSTCLVNQFQIQICFNNNKIIHEANSKVFFQIHLKMQIKQTILVLLKITKIMEDYLILVFKNIIIICQINYMKKKNYNKMKE